MRAKILFSLGLAAAPFAFSGPAYADDNEIVVTAPLEGAAIESLQGSSVLRREDIQNAPQGGLGETLKTVPGVASTFYGAGASRPIIRGLGDDRIRVLENGVGAIDASAASPDHAVTADGIDASRIEVLRGAAALAYGGNAIGGVVNVLDESIPTRRPDHLEGEASGAYQFGNQGQEAALDLGVGGPGGTAFHVSAAQRDSEDYETPIGDAVNSWADYRALSGGASLVRNWGFIGAAVKNTESQYGLPPEAPGEAGGHIEMNQTRYEVRGDLHSDLGPFNRFDFAVQSADYEHTEFEADGSPGTTFSNQGYEARGEAHHSGFGDKLSGAVGVQIIDTDFSAVGDEAFISPTSTQDHGVFAVERLDLGFWGLEGGARYETRNIDNQGGGTRDFDSASYSFGAFVRPAENWFLGATLARTERAPTGIELFANGPHLATFSYERGDTGLGKEVATSFETSLRYTTDPFAVELNLYRVDFANYIALINTGETVGTLGLSANPDLADLPVYDFTARDATFTGGELSARANLFKAGQFTISSDAALALVRADFDGGGNLPRIPPRTLTLGLNATSDLIDFRIEGVDTAAQNDVADFETKTDGFTVLNARASMRPFGNNVRFTVDGRNLTDELGRAHTSFLKDELPLPGRSVRFALSTSF